VRTPGFVTQIAAHDGQLLKKGDLILKLTDDQLDAQIAEQQAKVREAESRVQENYVKDQVQRQIEIETEKTLQGQLDDLLSRRAEQAIVAPIDGYLIAPKLADSVGRWMQVGEEAGTVAQMHELVVFAAINQSEAENAINEPNARAELRLAGDPGQKLYASEHRILDEATRQLRHPSVAQPGGGSFAIDPADRTGTKIKDSAFEVFASFVNPDSRYYPGQRVYVRLKLQRQPLLKQLTNRFLQLIQQRQQSPLV
jgi:multidrug efflux pump subunit AcrA (membrane-fusion protein)